jgi:hypothetical protein
MSFSSVKASVKIAVLIALNISSLGRGLGMTAVNAEEQESRISNKVAYTVNTSSSTS